MGTQKVEGGNWNREGREFDRVGGNSKKGKPKGEEKFEGGRRDGTRRRRRRVELR